jgi:hypothetical protein
MDYVVNHWHFFATVNDGIAKRLFCRIGYWVISGAGDKT